MILKRLGGGRGSVMVHVLVSGVIMAFIVASMMGLMLLHFGLTTRAHMANAVKKDNEGALSRMLANWNETGQVCSSFPGYACSGEAGTCSCSCDPDDNNMPEVDARPDTGNPDYCRIMISKDIPGPAPP